MRRTVLPAALLLLAAGSLILPGCGSWLSSKEPSRSEVSTPVDEGIYTARSTVALGRLTGPPQSVTDRIVRILDASSQRASLALLNYDGADGDFRLEGEFDAQPLKNKIKITYKWRVLDRDGTPREGSSGSKIVPGSSTEPWLSATDVVLESIVEQGITALTRASQGAKPPAEASVEPNAAAKRPSVMPTSAVAQMSPENGEVQVDAEEAVRLVNAYRKSKGLKPLTLDNGLMVAAAALSKAMAKQDRLSHVGPGKADLKSRLKTAKYNYALAAENVGMGQRSVAELISEWKLDPPQSRNMLIPDATQMGIACHTRTDTESKTYWTLVIAAPS